MLTLIVFVSVNDRGWWSSSVSTFTLASSHRVFYERVLTFFLKNEGHILKKIKKVTTSIESNSRTRSGTSVEQ